MVHILQDSQWSPLKEIRKSQRPGNRRKENPWNVIEMFPPHPKSWGYFTESMQQEVATRISQVDPQLWLACQMQYYCLIRPKEIRFLKIADLNLREGSIHVLSGMAKNKKSEFVRIPDAFKKSPAGHDDYPEDYYIFGKEGVPGIEPDTDRSQRD